jgi:hypothetical protein
MYFSKQFLDIEITLNGQPQTKPGSILPEKGSARGVTVHQDHYQRQSLSCQAKCSGSTDLGDLSDKHAIDLEHECMQCIVKITHDVQFVDCLQMYGMQDHHSVWA